MSRISPLISVGLALVLFAACGTDDAAEVATAADSAVSSQLADGESDGDLDAPVSEASGDDAGSPQPAEGDGDAAEVATAADSAVSSQLADGESDGDLDAPVSEASGDDAGSSQPVEGDGGSGDADDGGDDVLPTGPIPVEPDGGIGDGAQPLPGAEEPVETGTWHGAQVAETNCPGVDFVRVEASAFSFSVPNDFVDHQVQGTDSEVGQWSNGSGIEVTYDFGWYSYSLADAPGAQVEDVDYSGILGQFAVVRAAETGAETNSVGIYFPQVNSTGPASNKLGLIVTHDDPNDEIIGRCIVGSVEFG